MAAENKNTCFLGWQLIDQILTIGSDCPLKYKESEDGQGSGGRPYIYTSKNTYNDFLALSIFTHSDQMSKLQKLHLSVKQAIKDSRKYRLKAE